MKFYFDIDYNRKGKLSAILRNLFSKVMDLLKDKMQKIKFLKLVDDKTH